MHGALHSTSRWPIVLVVCLATGCASSAGRANRTSGRVITAEQIRKSSATNAWEVLKNSAAPLSLAERNGEPTAVHSRRGRSSIVIAHADRPVLIVDGTRMNDVAVLRQIPAESIESIRILSGIEGTTAQGTNSGGGVIIISTWANPDP